MKKQADHVAEAGGNAYVIDFTSHDPRQTASLQALFDRAEDYRQWSEHANMLRERLEDLDEVQARRQEARLRRELETIVDVDYFPGATREQALATLAAVQSAVNARFSPGEPVASGGAVPARSAADFQGRRWATRKSIWVDRIACAWLIRRFIDPSAEFVWLERVEDCPADAVGFDFDGATFSHRGDCVSFEVLARSFSLEQDPALARIAALVHYLDIGGAPVAEAAGFNAMLAGAKAAHADDDTLLNAGGELLNHLYTAYAQECDR